MFDEAIDDDINVVDINGGVTVIVCVVFVDDITVIVFEAIDSVPVTDSDVSIDRKELVVELLLPMFWLCSLLMSDTTV